MLVRSLYPDRTGTPVFGAGSFITGHESPLQERWGGWYVTGTHGAARHMGNAVLEGTHEPEGLDREAGANVTYVRYRLLRGTAAASVVARVLTNDRDYHGNTHAGDAADIELRA